MQHRHHLNCLLAAWLVLAMSGHAISATWRWEFTIDESQIRNGPEPDGSTNSPATGNGWVTYNDATNIMGYSFTWNDLFGELTKLHIHGPAGPQSSNPQHLVEIFGPPDIPAGVDLRNDTWTDSFELTTLIQPNFDPLTPTQIVAPMRQGLAYVNVHTNVFGMGEIRGNLGLPVPEPAVVWLYGWAAALVVARCRKPKTKCASQRRRTGRLPCRLRD